MPITDTDLTLAQRRYAAAQGNLDTIQRSVARYRRPTEQMLRAVSDAEASVLDAKVWLDQCQAAYTADPAPEGES